MFSFSFLEFVLLLIALLGGGLDALLSGDLSTLLG